MQSPNMDGRELWLVASGDRRVSVWSSDWSRTSCQLIDWLTFPGPACAPDGTVLRKGKKVNVIIDSYIITVLIMVATCVEIVFFCSSVNFTCYHPALLNSTLMIMTSLFTLAMDYNVVSTSTVCHNDKYCAPHH